MLLLLSGHSWEWWLTEAGPGLGALASFILVIYYARLFRETKEQTKATKAGYAPSIDADIDFDYNSIVLNIINRGEGVAKNIRLVIEVESTRFYLGEPFGSQNPTNYCYEVEFESTLRPNRYLTNNDGENSIKIHPIIAEKLNLGYRKKRLVDILEDQEHFHIKLSLKYTDVLSEREFCEVLYSKTDWFITGNTINKRKFDNNRLTNEIEADIEPEMISRYENELNEYLEDLFQNQTSDAERETKINGVRPNTYEFGILSRFKKFIYSLIFNDIEKMDLTHSDISKIESWFIIGSGISLSYSQSSKLEKYTFLLFGEPYTKSDLLSKLSLSSGSESITVTEKMDTTAEILEN